LPEPNITTTLYGVPSFLNRNFHSRNAIEIHDVVGVEAQPYMPPFLTVVTANRLTTLKIFNALEPIQHAPCKTAQIYAHSGEEILSTIDPGALGVPVLKHLHHVSCS
jgi:hypothetical protein